MHYLNQANVVYTFKECKLTKIFDALELWAAM